MNTTIERLRCQYLIPSSHPAPETIQARLDNIARDYLAGVCSSLLTSLLDPYDTSFWLIRRLDVSVSFNVERLDVAAQLWGRSIVKALIRALTIADEIDQDLVRHFPNHDAYVAQFISDLVAGRAWDQWYYRTFDSLRSLSTSSAIRTVLTREPEQIASILAILAAQDRSEPVLHCLSEGDARLLYEIGYPAHRPAKMLVCEPSLMPEIASDGQLLSHTETNVASSMSTKLSATSKDSQSFSTPDKLATNGQLPSSPDMSGTNIADNELIPDRQSLSTLDKLAADRARSGDNKQILEDWSLSSLDSKAAGIARSEDSKQILDGQPHTEVVDIVRSEDNKQIPGGQPLSTPDKEVADRAGSGDNELTPGGQPLLWSDMQTANRARSEDSKLISDGRSLSLLDKLAADIARSGDSKLATNGQFPSFPDTLGTNRTDNKPIPDNQPLSFSNVPETNVVESKQILDGQPLSSLDMQVADRARSRDDKPTADDQNLSLPDMQGANRARSEDNRSATDSQRLSTPDMSRTNRADNKSATDSRYLSSSDASGKKVADSKPTPDGQPLSSPDMYEINVVRPIGSSKRTPDEPDEKEKPAILESYGDGESEPIGEVPQPGDAPLDECAVVAPIRPPYARLNPHMGIEISATVEADIYITQEATAREERHILELLLSAWSRASLQLSEKRIATPHNALRLYTTLWAQVSHYSCATVRKVIEHILSFTQLLRILGQPAQIISHMLDNNLTAALDLLREANLLPYLKSLSYLQQIALGDTALLRRIASTVAPSTSVTRGTAANGPLQPVTTLLGGIFLLLPSFIDLKFHELLEHAPYFNIAEEQNQPILRYILFLKCFGLLYAQWPDIAYDPILLLISSTEEIPMTEELQQLSQNVTLSIHLAWQCSLIRQQIDYHYAEGRCLYAELVEVGTSPILLIRDMHHDAWLYIRSVSQDVESVRVTLMDGLAIIHEAINRPVEFLVLGKGLEHLSLVDILYDQPLWIVWTEPGQSAIRMAWQPSAVISHNESASEECGLAQEKSVELLHSIQQLTAVDKDLRYLTLHAHTQPMIEQRDLDLTLSLFARVLMRTFARRLMGFGKSSCEYLYQNFLAGTASVLIQHDLLEVQIPRPPLHLVLRIAGMHEQSYTIPWSARQVIVELMS